MTTNITLLNGAQWAEQDTASIITYTRDWSDLLLPGDSIASSVWGPVAGITLTNEAVNTALTTVTVAATLAGLYRITNTVTTTAGRQDVRTFLLYVVVGAVLVKSDLFYRDEFLAKFRRDRLPSVQRYLSGPVSDDYLWGKLLSAESAARRELKVYFVPTALFPNDPTQAEIDALLGAPWAVDPGYDFDQDIVQPGGWSFLKLRQKPVITLESIKFSYPSMCSGSRLKTVGLAISGFFGSN